MILSKQKPSKSYSYGYDRFEVLSSFSNATFLVFVSLFLIKETIERLFEPVEMFGDTRTKVIYVALLSLILNIIGGRFFRKRYSRSRTEAHEDNVYGIFLHILSDGLSSIGVIFSTWLMSWGIWSADPLVALGISIWIISKVFPLWQKTSLVLLQTTPLAIFDQLQQSLKECSTLEGVLECRKEHFWTQSPGVYVGSFYVRVRSDTNSQAVLSRALALFSPLISHLTIQVERDDFFKSK